MLPSVNEGATLCALAGSVGTPLASAPLVATPPPTVQLPPCVTDCVAGKLLTPTVPVACTANVPALVTACDGTEASDTGWAAPPKSTLKLLVFDADFERSAYAMRAVVMRGAPKLFSVMLLVATSSTTNPIGD